MNWVAGNVSTRFKVIMCVILVLALVACGGGGGGGGNNDKPGTDAPAVLAHDTASITEDAVPDTVSGNVLANDSDPDTVLAVTNTGTLSGPSAYGSFSIASNGDFTYTLDNGNTTVDALNDGETLTESFDYEVTGGATATLTVTIDGATDASETPVDVSGVWKIEATVASDNPTGCAGGVGATSGTYITIAQSGSDLNIRELDGGALTGTIDANGDFILNGSKSFDAADLAQPTDPNAFVTYSKTLNATGTGVSETSLSGSVATTSQASNSSACTYTENFTGNFVYRHTGTEDYNGVFALEMYGEEVSSDGTSGAYREGFALEMEISGSTIALHFSDEGPAAANDSYTFSNPFFDPNTGFFSIELDEVERADYSDPPDGIIDESSTKHTQMSGIFLRDPAVTNGGDGNPLVEAIAKEYGRSYTGDVLSDGTAVSAQIQQQETYGKRLVTQAMTRTTLIDKGDQIDTTAILVGLFNPPLKRINPNSANSDNSALYVQVLDEGGTILCSVPYIYDGVMDSRYFEQINKPDPNFEARNFRGNTYSSVNCNTAAGRPGTPVTDGELLNVRVLDSGPNGLMETSSETPLGDDSLVTIPVLNTESIAYNAEVVPNADRFTETPKAFDIDVNGTRMSTTLGGGKPALWGYFDINDPLTVSWPTITGVDQYQLRVQGPGVDDYVKYRYRTPDTSVTIPAGDIQYDQEFNLRLVGVDTTTSNGATGMTFSRHLNIKPGVRGLFNIELGNGLPLAYRTFQVYIEADLYGGGYCAMPYSIWGVACTGTNSASVDSAANTVTLTMEDIDGVYTTTPGTTFNLVLHFNDAGTAEITSPDSIPGVPATPGANTASARVANPEFYLRTRRLSHNGVQRTHLNVTNSYPGLFTQAILSREDGGVFGDGITTALVLWDENQALPYSDVASEFTTVPTDDGNAQRTKLMASLSSNAMGFGNVMLASGVYRLDLIDQTGTAPDQVLRFNYTAPDAGNYIAPAVQSINLDGVLCSATTCNNPAAPITVSATLDLSWAIDASVPAGSYWRIHFRPTDSTGNAAGEAIGQIRTPFMQNGDFGLNITGSAATWTNPGDLALPSGSYEVQIYVYDSPSGYTGTVFGSSTGPGGVGGDQVYVTVP